MIGTENTNMYMPVAPAYMGGNCNNGFGNGDWGEWIILFLIFGMFGGYGNGWGNGFGGGNGTNGLYPWLNNSNQINDGFRDQMLNTTINGIQNGVVSGFGDVQNSLCAGFSGVNASIAAAQNGISNQLYNTQIADMNQRFSDTLTMNNQMNNLAASLQNCCCENRASTADLKYTVATEACSDRNTSNQNTQAILTALTAGVQSIKDQICQDKIDAKNDTIEQLRSELLYARGQASQVSQTAAIEQYVRPNPSPAYIVANPYCNYNQNYGCGCSGVA